MARKKVVKKPSNQVPEDLKVFIESTIKSAFPELQNINNLITVTGGFLDEVDYQFNLRGITSKLTIEPNEVLQKIKANLQENTLLKDLELSCNSSFINIYTRISRQKPCKICGIQLKLGRQPIAFRPGDKKICDWINEELLLRQMSELRITDEGL
jgi:hypothetical protein